MTVFDLVTLGVTLALVVIAALLTTRTLVFNAATRPRRILGASGVLLVAASTIIFVEMRLELARTPNVAGDLNLALTVLRRYTRYRPEYLALAGIALGFAGTGKGRWVLLLAGLLIATWWYLFEVSFL